VKLEGSIETFSLRELIDMVVYSSVTGALTISGPGAQGRLYFRDGTLYHVERGPAQGVDALAELLELGTGTFTFASNLSAEAVSLWGGLSHHLQMAERMAARWRMVRPYIPHLDLTPMLLFARETALRRAGAAHQPVLLAIDGQASLRQLAADLGWAEIDLAEAVVQMTLDGLIDLRNQPRSETPQSDDTEAASSSGLFDRLLTRGSPAHRITAETELARPAAENRPPEDLILKLLGP
jgi:hypothetical protein